MSRKPPHKNWELKEDKKMKEEMKNKIKNEIKKGIIAQVRAKVPLIHNITNYVTVNDVANILLACGGSPIMADDEAEAEDITSICSGLNINIGTLNSRTIQSMILAGKRATSMGKVVVLDPVGAGASVLRTKTAKMLMQEIPFSVIRGNVSEIKALFDGASSTKGVDADLADKVTEENLDEAVVFVKECSKASGAVIAMTGAIDVVGDSEKVYAIRNGNALMSSISGTGCMLSGVVAAYCVANQDSLVDAAAIAVATMGLCGEIAYQRLEETPMGGTSSYRTFIIDAMSNISDEMLEKDIKIERR